MDMGDEIGEVPRKFIIFIYICLKKCKNCIRNIKYDK